MNSVNLTGRLTKDPEIVHHNERPICELRLAVDNGRHPTTYIDVRTFDGQAYTCAEYLAKGRRIGVSGKLVYGEWKAEDGSHRERYSVIGHVEFLDGRRSEEAPESEVDPSEERQEELVAA